MPVIIEKARVNLWNLAGFAVGLVVTAFGWGITYAKLTNDTDFLRQQIADMRIQTAELKQQAPHVLQLQFQTTQLNKQAAETRTALEETNKRMDRIVESWGGKLDMMLANVNKLQVAVEVLTSKVDAQPKRINLNTPTESNMFGLR